MPENWKQLQQCDDFGRCIEFLVQRFCRIRINGVSLSRLDKVWQDSSREGDLLTEILSVVSVIWVMQWSLLGLFDLTGFISCSDDRDNFSTVITVPSRASPPFRISCWYFRGVSLVILQIVDVALRQVFLCQTRSQHIAKLWGHGNTGPFLEPPAFTVQYSPVHFTFFFAIAIFFKR